jgi:hypothetical protein
MNSRLPIEGAECPAHGCGEGGGESSGATCCGPCKRSSASAGLMGISPIGGDAARNSGVGSIYSDFLGVGIAYSKAPLYLPWGVGLKVRAITRARSISAF